MPSRCVEVRNAKSGSGRRRLRQGLPQEGVLLPALINQYLSKMPDVTLTSYAEDCTAIATGPYENIEEMNETVNNYLPELNDWTGYY